MSARNYGLDTDSQAGSSDLDQPASAAAFLRTTGAIRTRAAALLARAREGQSQWFPSATRRPSIRPREPWRK